MLSAKKREVFDMTVSLSVPRLNTIGRIADSLAEKQHRVEYVLRTRPHIRPSALAGPVRLYDRQAVAQIRHELNAIDAKRGGQP